MIRNEENHELIDHFINELETYGLTLGTQLEQLESEKADYLFYADIVHQLDQSKIDFCASYFALSEEKKALFQKKLLALFKDQEIVENIVQEIINLYYLNESGLLEEEEVASQKEIALENLDTLSLKISKYLSDTSYDLIVSKHDQLSSQMDSLVLLGSIIEGEDEAIGDIDFLADTLEKLSLTVEEKKQILFEILHYNHMVYQKQMEKKKQDSLEQPGELEELRDNPVISEECLNRIDELLSQKDILERIVRVIQDDFTVVIHFRSPSAEDIERIEDSLSFAKEMMIDSMLLDPEKTPEQALDDFFQQYDETARHKRELIAQLTESTLPSSLSPEEQKKVFQTAYDFLKNHMASIGDMHKSDKERVRQYMLGLFQNAENRKMMYDGGMLENRELLDREVAYEISVYQELLEAVDEDDQETIAKVCTKLQEILECAHIGEPIQEKENLDAPGHLFFVMDDEDLAAIEVDIGEKDKGISNAFYGDIRNQLLNIEGRSKKRISISQPLNAGLKALKKNGVQYTFSPKIKTFFIPIGKQDAIVVGTGFLNGKDVFKDQDRRVKKYQEQIDRLIERLSNPDTYTKELVKAMAIRERILSQLEPKELDEMFEDTPGNGEKRGKKK